MGSSISSNKEEEQYPDAFVYTESSAYSHVPSTVTHLIISEQVHHIEEDAFEHNESLKKVTLHHALKKIGLYAFWGCTALREMTIPTSVVKIEEGTFSVCTSLVRVSFPHSLTEIGRYAFGRCVSLIQATLPETLQTIGHSAFRDCSSLVSAHVPKSLQYLGPKAFHGCSNLSIIAIPDHVTISPDAFKDCTLINRVKEEVQSTTDTTTSSKAAGDYKFLRYQHRFANLPLHKVCYDPNLDLDTLKTCIATTDKNSLNKIDSFSMNALHILCANPNVTHCMISTLITACPSLRTMKSIEGMTPLMMFIKCKGILSHEAITINNVERLSLSHCLRLGLDWNDIEFIFELDNELRSEVQRKNEDTGLYPFMEIAANQSYGLNALYGLVHSDPGMLFDN